MESKRNLQSSMVELLRMYYIDKEMKHNPKRQKACQIVQTYSLVKGLKMFGDHDGRDAGFKK